MCQAAFFELFHAGLLRLGPGSFEDTARALGQVTGLPAKPNVADLGCGNGAQTLALAKLLPHARISAVDIHQRFLVELVLRARQEGVHERIQVLQADMAKLPFSPQTFDLIWSEGAAYNIGFANALKGWRMLLKPSATVVLSHIAWFRPDAPEEARSFWSQEYPDMEDEAALVQHVAERGYMLVSCFRLSPQTWWRDFYTPLTEELGRFRARHADKPEWLAVADMTEREMNVHRDYSDYYGYTFFICRRAD
jgi:SAM-dependent methyltransferase